MSRQRAVGGWQHDRAGTALTNNVVTAGGRLPTAGY
jgi:hypothetical protein